MLLKQPQDTSFIYLGVGVFVWGFLVVWGFVFFVVVVFFIVVVDLT